MNRISKLYALSVLALALLLALSTPVLANEMQGTMTSLAPDDFTFTMTDDEGTEHNFRFLIGGQVIINDEERMFAELQSGDRLVVIFEFQDKELVATMVRSTRY